tara:strand:+ start:1685 stop:1819 length:135 start_codon:yes stop_codon:yes gene_type:complete
VPLRLDVRTHYREDDDRIDYLKDKLKDKLKVIIPDVHSRFSCAM